MQWILREDGTKTIHYLDDFLLFGAPESDVCDRALSRALSICTKLGVDCAFDKEGLGTG